MAFVSGPRQVGKTTMARSMLSTDGTYFSWDIATDRRRLARDPYFFERDPRQGSGLPLLVFDELHKYARWKNYLKGVFDGFGDRYRILVTGSGRLDLYKRGGDSLLGRYVSLTLFPLSVGELAGERPAWRDFLATLSDQAAPSPVHAEIFEHLWRTGGFPEPFVRASEEFYRVWSAGRTERLVREEVRDTTGIRELSLVEVLVHLLGPRVGSPLSINSLREDLGVAFETVRSWIDVLSTLYYCFRLAPWSRRVARALRKEAKVYLWDWAELDSDAARFENLVALHLRKAVRAWTEVGEARLDLHYLRDKEKREVDFVLTESGRPRLLVECKLADDKLSPHLLYFQQQMDVPCAVQLLRVPGHARRTAIGGRTQWVVSADRWLARLP